MPVYNIDVPERNSIDALAELREQRDARVRARMSKKAYKDAILEAISDAMDDERHPLGEMVGLLFDCPIRDSYDYKAFLHLRDGRRIGATVLTMTCDASLAAYQEADDIGF
jgi:hypothetical protein